MTTTNVESDPLFQLVTDALRAGPASPEWRDAVARVRNGQKGTHSDEYQLLLQAREDLESGRDYRSVRAGAGFTRQVMEGIDKEATGGGGGLPMANIIAGISAFTILGVLTLVAVLLMRGGPKTPSTDTLVRRIFTQTVASVTQFAGDRVAPEGWRQFGSLQLTANEALATAPAAGDSAAPGPGVGGIVTASPVAADEPVSIKAEVEVPGADSGCLMQIFLADQDPAARGGAAGEREVAWTAGGSEGAVVRVGGRTTGRAPSPVASDNARRQTVEVRADAEAAAVFVGDQLVWAGPHAFNRGAPRLAGIRFIRSGPPASADAPRAAVHSVQVRTSSRASDVQVGPMESTR